MGYQLKVNQPNLPQGGAIYISGLGEFENGKTYDISDEQEQAFRTRNGYQKEVLGPDREPTGELRWSDGPSLADCNFYGVEVTKTQTEEQTVQTEEEQTQEEQPAEGGEE